MISLNDVLLAMSNIPVDDPIAEIWGQGLQGGYRIIEYTGTLPITINANGDALLDYRIYGADGGVGVATENLIDADKPGTQRVELEPNTDYCLCKYVGSQVGRPQCNVYDENDNKLFGDYINVWVSYSFTNPSNGAYAIISFNNSVKGKLSFTKGRADGASSLYPASYIPYGYKLPMTVTSENLFDENAKDVDKGFVLHKVFNTDGSLGYSSLYSISEYMQVEPLKEYFLENFHNPEWSRAYGCACFYDSNKNVLSVISASDNDSLILTAPELARFIRISVYFPTCKFYSSMPQNVPVYIGENQLTENEYVSYGEQKIYRDVSGTLTPTDPPVPLPEIPTIDGTTIIDYDGDPKPSQMYIKYKGKG